MRLRGEVNELSEEMEKIKCKWWHKLFKKYEYCGYAAIFRMIDGRRLEDTPLRSGISQPLYC